MNWIRRKRIGRLRTRVAEMSGGEFLDFSLDENGILACLKCHGDIPCVSRICIPRKTAGVFRLCIFKTRQNGKESMSL